MQKILASLADDLSDSGTAGDWLDLGRVASGLFYRHAAEQYFEKSLQVAGTQGDDEGRSKALSALGNLYSEDEDWQRACSSYEMALEALDEGKNKAGVISILESLGDVCRRLGDLGKAEQCHLRILRLVDDRAARAGSLSCLGDLLLLKGEHSRAQECYEKSLADWERLQDRRGMARSLAALASIHKSYGKVSRAESCLLSARRHLLDAGDCTDAAGMSCLLGDLFFEQGRFQEAADYYEKGIEHVHPSQAAEAQARVGQCLQEMGDLLGAEDRMRRAQISRGGRAIHPRICWPSSPAFSVCRESSMRHCNAGRRY